MHITKKSQMEIVGLVIIVILLSLALLFFLRFSIGKTATEKQTFTSAQLASNMINTLSKTTTNCSRFTISDLYILCANLDEEVDCDGDGWYESNACEVANNTMDDILPKTLEQWNKRYRFQVFIPENEENPLYSRIKEFNKCTGNIQTETYYLPVYEGLLYLRLNLCED